MQTAKKKKPHTYKDYARLPEGAPYELIDGELVKEPAPTPYHQIVAANLTFALQQFVRKHSAGTVLNAPIDVYLSKTNTFQPDIIFIDEKRRPIITDQNIEGPPDLVAEVLSPSTGYYDLREKKQVYETSGVREYWIVDPKAASIERYENTQTGFRLAAEVQKPGRLEAGLFNGFSVDLEDIF